MWKIAGAMIMSAVAFVSGGLIMAVMFVAGAGLGAVGLVASIGSVSGGAFDPITGSIALGLGGLAFANRRRKVAASE